VKRKPDLLSPEETEIRQALVSARTIQEFLWGELNGKWDLEEWRRMFRKRVAKIDEINPLNPHAKIELKKRLLQNAALSIAMLHLLNNGGLPESCKAPSNLPQYAKNRYHLYVDGMKHGLEFKSRKEVDAYFSGLGSHTVRGVEWRNGYHFKLYDDQRIYKMIDIKTGKEMRVA
jgi:hypothetical protein